MTDGSTNGRAIILAYVFVLKNVTRSIFCVSILLVVLEQFFPQNAIEPVSRVALDPGTMTALW